MFCCLALGNTRFDLTKEKRYTLSRATNDLLKKLDDDLEIEVFLKGEFPSGFRKLANSTGRVLAVNERKECFKDSLPIYSTAR